MTALLLGAGKGLIYTFGFFFALFGFQVKQTQVVVRAQKAEVQRQAIQEALEELQLEFDEKAREEIAPDKE